MIELLEGPVSTVVLWLNVVLYAAFLGFYGTREPWRRSWVGWTVMLLAVAILQFSIRAALTDFLGEDYPGRDLVLLLGRVELFISGAVVFVGLLRLRRHSR